MRKDIARCLAAHQERMGYPLRLYGLVDGLTHARVSPNDALSRSESSAALFDGTPDQVLAHAGPWLLEATDQNGPHRAVLGVLAESEEGLIWLISAYPLSDLADALRERLNVRLPSGKLALLRHYDARVSGAILGLLSERQRAEFFAPVHGWLTQCTGKLTRIHPTDAA
ncbi:DUF4123 domain-containing protein [Orrella dioscoreae]|uniref:DUF4123 domain-containing protein n=1 Tax=Orrella dioscoreae TaxID=1851544 RepID=UPI000830DDE4|nr:DUF4123 domain-containing protein [Orrella dioscoreae]